MSREIEMKIGYWEDDEYEVYDASNGEQLHRGTLSECESFINLKNEGIL